MQFNRFLLTSPALYFYSGASHNRFHLRQIVHLDGTVTVLLRFPLGSVMMGSLTNEARILLEAAALALEINYPDIKLIRDMIKQADELLAKAQDHGRGPCPPN
jgi:hypothetical protein